MRLAREPVPVKSASIQVRLYRSGDFDRTWPLFEQVSRFYHGDDAPTAERMRSYVRDRVLAADSAMRLALAFEGSTPVGFAAFAILYPGPETSGQLYLKELFVSAPHRCKGAGRALMKFLAAHALEHECSRMDWTGETGNPSGLSFYRALGVAPSRDKVYFRLSGKALDEFAKQ